MGSELLAKGVKKTRSSASIWACLSVYSSRGSFPLHTFRARPTTSANKRDGMSDKCTQTPRSCYVMGARKTRHGQRGYHRPVTGNIGIQEDWQVIFQCSAKDGREVKKSTPRRRQAVKKKTRLDVDRLSIECPRMKTNTLAEPTGALPSSNCSYPATETLRIHIHFIQTGGLVRRAGRTRGHVAHSEAMKSLGARWLFLHAAQRDRLCGSCFNCCVLWICMFVGRPLIRS